MKLDLKKFSELNRNAFKDFELLGWIRCITDYPSDEEQVLVTDGKEVWMGD